MHVLVSFFLCFHFDCELRSNRGFKRTTVVVVVRVQAQWMLKLPYTREMTTLLNMSPFLNKSPSKNEFVKKTTLLNRSNPNLRSRDFLIYFIMFIKVGVKCFFQNQLAIQTTPLTENRKIEIRNRQWVVYSRSYGMFCCCFHVYQLMNQW